MKLHKSAAAALSVCTSELAVESVVEAAAAATVWAVSDARRLSYFPRLATLTQKLLLLFSFPSAFEMDCTHVKAKL